MKENESGFSLDERGFFNPKPKIKAGSPFLPPITCSMAVHLRYYPPVIRIAIEREIKNEIRLLFPSFPLLLLQVTKNPIHSLSLSPLPPS